MLRVIVPKRKQFPGTVVRDLAEAEAGRKLEGKGKMSMIIPSGSEEILNQIEKDSHQEMAPLVSVHAQREGFSPLLEAFVGRLPERTSSLEEALQHADLVEVKSLAHKLKGAAGGYGYPEISQIAGQIELLADDSEGAQTIEPLLRELIYLSQRAELALKDL